MAPPLRSSTPTLDGRIRTATPASATLHCCCDRALCPALRRSTVMIESIEKDAHTAAQLGQALLARYEAFKADAERDRLVLTTRINRLEMENRSLEAANAAKIEENRALLDQLETLNTTVSDADSKIRLLEANLLSSSQSVRRLESSAARAVDAERHISLLEQEQECLHEEIRSNREDARSQLMRLKEAQRAVMDMQDQLDRLESEANQERERHADVVKRMERQRDVEKQLDAAAGRLKGAAATRSLQGNGKNNNVVGHFVRDLLQDNASLQLGISELKELLDSSNDEIQSLREQMAYEQPAGHHHHAPPGPTLRAELGGDYEDGSNHTGPAPSQQVHIHHHYHAAPLSKHGKKLKRTRTGLIPVSMRTPSVHSRASMSALGSPPQADSKWSGHLPSSPTAPALISDVSQTEVTPTSSKPAVAWLGQYNLQSDYSSSAPSSPLANAHGVFDKGYLDLHASLTSPATSLDPLSPPWTASHGKQLSIASTRSLQSCKYLDSEPELPPLPRESIAEEDETTLDANCLGMAQSGSMCAEDVDVSPSKDRYERRNLRRAASHESIMSLSGGLDIHTLHSRPSQMTLRPMGGANAVVTGVVAQPTLARSTNKRSDAALRENFAGLKPPRTIPLPNAGSQSKLRGWTTWRPWGGVGVSEGERSSSPGMSDGPVTPANKGKEKEKGSGRSPGINQPGSIPGFQEYWASQKRKGAPAQVNAQVVDCEALTEGLLE